MTRWLIHGRNLLLTVLEAGSPTSGLGGPDGGVSSLLLVSSHGRRAGSSVGSLLWTIISFMSDPASYPSHLPETSPSNTITLGTRISTSTFLGNTNIQPIVGAKWLSY